MAGTVMPVPPLHRDGLMACSCPPPAMLSSAPIPVAAGRDGCAVCRSESGTACSRRGAGVTPCGHISAGDTHTFLMAPCPPPQPPHLPVCPEVSPEGPGPSRDAGSGCGGGHFWVVQPSHPSSAPQIPLASLPLPPARIWGGMLLNRDTCPCSAWSILLWRGRGGTVGATRVALPPGAVAVTVTHCPESPVFLSVVPGWSCGGNGMGL